MQPEEPDGNDQNPADPEESDGEEPDTEPLSEEERRGLQAILQEGFETERAQDYNEQMKRARQDSTTSRSSVRSLRRRRKNAAAAKYLASDDEDSERGDISPPRSYSDGDPEFIPDADDPADMEDLDCDEEAAQHNNETADQAEAQEEDEEEEEDKQTEGNVKRRRKRKKPKIDCSRYDQTDKCLRAELRQEKPDDSAFNYVDGDTEADIALDSTYGDFTHVIEDDQLYSNRDGFDGEPEPGLEDALPNASVRYPDHVTVVFPAHYTEQDKAKKLQELNDLTLHQSDNFVPEDQEVGQSFNHLGRARLYLRISEVTKAKT